MGMNTGLQDAYNLAWKLAFQLRRENGAPLNSYDSERRQVGLEVLRRTEMAMALEEGQPLMVEDLGDFISGWAQLDVDYRDGPLSLERLGPGDIQAGDRAPDGGRPPYAWPR